MFKLLKFTLKAKLILMILCLSYVANSWASYDPTKPLFGTATVNKAKQYSPLVLQTIIKKNQQYKAVINGKLLSQGDSILGYKVKRISVNNALLIKSDKRIKLSLFTNYQLVKSVKK